MKLHVITNKEAIRSEELEGKVVVVFDILLATTTIVAALHSGAEAVIPVKDEEEARVWGKREPSSILSGEWNGKTIEGFLDPSPYILKNKIKGKKLILSSTNGTRAIRLASGAKVLYIGSLLNASALTDHLARVHSEETVLLLCSGSSGHLSLEDFFGAGIFVLKLKQKLSEDVLDLTDAALAALHLAQSKTSEAASLLSSSRVGQMMKMARMERELMLAAQIGGYQELPILINEQITLFKEGVVPWEHD
jgi:2-phosphosulfolactate phosphatase